MGGQAVQEYQDFLSGKNQGGGEEGDIPSVIMADDVNSPFVSALKSLSSTENEDVLITPNDEIPSELYGKESFPIYIVLSPDRLDVLLRENLPTKWKSKLDDFVFVTWLGYNIEPI